MTGVQTCALPIYSLEVWYAHVPGLKVLAPAPAHDARHMLAAALADPDPVVIVEHAMLYATEGEVEEADAAFDAWHAAVRREGRDVTLVTSGGSLGKTLAAAERLAADGVETEVIDLRCLRPLDADAITRSVAKTHRVVVVEIGRAHV